MPGQTITVWDYLFNGLLGFVLGYKIPYALANLERWKADPGSVLLTTEGWWWSGLLLGAAFAGVLRVPGSPETRAGPEADSAVHRDAQSTASAPSPSMAALGGILGAKFFAIIEYLPAFFDDPLGVRCSAATAWPFTVA